ncbi:MAG: EamA family transporter [Anaerolineaceae bacterium 4572_32.2]|nr:MAG: EamA family transporter [Anaerolineaceae bacterium 4572_32.2]
MKNGIISAIGAYVLWGLLPVYWKTIQAVPAVEVICHRVVWSFVVVMLLLVVKSQWGWLRQIRKNPATLLTFFGTGALLALNWLTYIWAVSTGHIVDSSLGYFINPLISVLFGMLFLGEHLRPWQWAAILLALGGVTFLTLGYGSFPWIALTLATTFGLYGLLRKTAPLGALDGLVLEMTILFLPALAYLVYIELAGSGSFGHTGAVSGLLTLTGVITAFPLIWFAYGARKVTLATVGILQYIAPTLQFLLGVLVYGEAFEKTRLVGFGAIWTALLIYSIEGVVEGRRKANLLLSTPAQINRRAGRQGQASHDS